VAETKVDENPRTISKLSNDNNPAGSKLSQKNDGDKLKHKRGDNKLPKNPQGKQKLSKS